MCRALEIVRISGQIDREMTDTQRKPNAPHVFYLNFPNVFSSFANRLMESSVNDYSKSICLSASGGS